MKIQMMLAATVNSKAQNLDQEVPEKRLFISSTLWSLANLGKEPADFYELGEQIYSGPRQDFTFIHPEVLEEGCVIDGNTLVLNNKVNREVHSVLIIPGSKVLSVETVREIIAWYDAGGIVIATKILPGRSTEAGKDEEVRMTMEGIFGMLLYRAHIECENII